MVEPANLWRERIAPRFRDRAPQVVRTVAGEDVQGDVAVKDGVIAEVGRVAGGAARTIDAEGLVVAPGFVDMHTSSSVARRLATGSPEGPQWEFAFVGFMNDDQEAVGKILQSPYAVIGISDAGAHLVSKPKADYGLYFLATWIRERRLLSLEQAIMKLTFMPASLMGFHDRGLLRTGMAADMGHLRPADCRAGTRAARPRPARERGPGRRPGPGSPVRDRQRADRL